MAHILTDPQRSLLQFIQGYIKDNGWPPTLREMAVHYGWTSTNAGADHLRRLSSKGYVTVATRVSRGVRLTEKALAELATPEVTP